MHLAARIRRLVRSRRPAAATSCGAGPHGRSGAEHGAECQPRWAHLSARTGATNANDPPDLDDPHLAGESSPLQLRGCNARQFLGRSTRDTFEGPVLELLKGWAA